MTSFSGLSIGLSLVFGCLLLALVAELYYLVWWKKRRISSSVDDDDDDDDRMITNYAKELVHLFCWKQSASLHAPDDEDLGKNKDINGVEVLEPDLELGSRFFKGFGEESVESELMRLHNLAGPPRFLFTINEETREDLESEDGRSRTRSCLSDLMLTAETPFLSPLASPPTFNTLDSYHNRNGFNPLLESSTDAELNKLRSSPPPKFKFLRDAEEKLVTRLMMLEAEKRYQSQRNNGGGGVNKAVINNSNTNKTVLTEETEGSFLKFIVPSSSSQILPLSSSPTK